MLMTLFLFLILAATAAAIWFQGLWSAAVTLVNMTLAMLLATNFFEPICDLIESLNAASYTYLLDFIVLWFLFTFFYVFLRGFTDLFSRTRVKFDMPVEMAGRTILALWCGWLMMSFVAFSLLMAPLNSPTPMGAWTTPASGSFLGMKPERLWLAFMHSRSRGALARGNFSGESHPSDEDLNVEVFDPHGEFLIKYRSRREKYSKEGESLRFAR